MRSDTRPARWSRESSCPAGGWGAATQTWVRAAAGRGERGAGREPDPRSWATVSAKRRWLDGEPVGLAAEAAAAREAAREAAAGWAAARAAVRAAAEAAAEAADGPRVWAEAAQNCQLTGVG